MKGKRNLILIVIIVCLPVFLILFNSISELNKTKLEGELIQAGKIQYAVDVIAKFTEHLKNGEIDSIKPLLSDDCSFYNENRVFSLEDCLKQLNDYKSCRYEEHGNSIKDEETYRIIWNGSNENDAEQILTIILSRKVTKEEIKYEVTSIILSNK